jgi:23S rRNA (guanine745-N1)-methyltransferase
MDQSRANPAFLQLIRALRAVPSADVHPLPLACTVRGCGRPLERVERRFACAKRHTYDVARSGYVNLLQPQDRRSAAPGDSSTAVEARAALLADGVGRALLRAAAERVAALHLPPHPVCAELGCGGGDALAAVAAARPLAGIGIDLSTAAADRAARRHPTLAWVVANADRRLPLLDGRVDLVLSLHGRRNPAECARVLAPGGFLLVAIPAPDDLIELRTLVQGQGVARDRSVSLIAGHAPFFTVQNRAIVRERPRLPRASLFQLLRGTYRGARGDAADRLRMVTRMDVTFASEILLFAPGSSAAAPSQEA